MFKLDPKLNHDSFLIDDLPLSQLRMMNDKQFPWLLLIPRRDNISELIDLNENEQTILLKEINSVSHALRKMHQPDKLNIATLGNIVKQLHIHIIARFKNDACWPKPVWGQIPAQTYTEEEQIKVIEKLKNQLSLP